MTPPSPHAAHMVRETARIIPFVPRVAASQSAVTSSEAFPVEEILAPPAAPVAPVMPRSSLPPPPDVFRWHAGLGVMSNVTVLELPGQQEKPVQWRQLARRTAWYAGLVVGGYAVLVLALLVLYRWV